MGPANRYYMIEGCLYGGTTDHMTEQCFSYDTSKPEELAQIILKERMNRQMLASSIALKKHPSALEGGGYHTCQSRSAYFA
jgi:hypothetical protein